MNKLSFVLCAAAALSMAACSKKRVAECDAFVETVEKLAKCEKFPPEARQEIKDAAKTIRDALQLIDDAGGIGDAPADVVNSLRDTCKQQNDAVLEQYKKVVPDCFK